MKRSKSLCAKDSQECYVYVPDTAPELETVGLCRALFNLCSYNFPIVLCNILAALVETINLIFVGRRFDIIHLAAVGMSYCWFNICTYSVLLGLAANIQDDCAEARMDNNWSKCKQIFNRSRYLLLICSVILIALFIWIAKFWLTLIHVPEELAGLVQSYLHHFSPGIIFLAQFEAAKLYANACGVNYMQIIVSAITTSLHIFWCILFADYGFEAAALATSLTNFLNFLGLTLGLHCCVPVGHLPCFSISDLAFETWVFLSRGLPQSLPIVIEWLGVELITIETCYLSNIAVAATVIIQNFMSILFLIPWGIALSSSSLIENSIDSCHIRNARRFALRAVLLSVIIVGGISVVFSFARSETCLVPQIEARELHEKLFEYIIPAAIFFDGLQGSFAGVIRGLGKEDIASYGTLTFYFLISQPCAIILGFLFNLGLEGLWTAMVIGYSLNSLFFGGIIISQDWSRITRAPAPRENQKLVAFSANEGTINSMENQAAASLLPYSQS